MERDDRRPWGLIKDERGARWQLVKKFYKFKMRSAGSKLMSWLPKRDKLDPVQASAIDFAVAQEGNFSIKGEAGTGKSVVLAHVAAKFKAEGYE